MLVTMGSYTVEHFDPAARLMVWPYGFQWYDSFGHPGGWDFAQRFTVTFWIFHDAFARYAKSLEETGVDGNVVGSDGRYKDIVI